MDLLERILLLCIGLSVGFILGYIVRSLRAIEKELHVVHDETDQLCRQVKNDDGFLHINRVVTDLLYLVILGVTIFGVVRAESALNAAEEDDQQDLVARCEAGQDSRDVTRGIVDAVYTLAAGFAVRGEDEPPRTPQEELELDLYLDRLDHFRTSTYADIKPSEECAPHVTDDNQKPTPIVVPGLEN